MAQPHMAIMCIGVRAAVKDMAPVEHSALRPNNAWVHLSRALERVVAVGRTRILLARLLTEYHSRIFTHTVRFLV